MLLLRLIFVMLFGTPNYSEEQNLGLFLTILCKTDSLGLQETEAEVMDLLAVCLPVCAYRE